MLGASATGTTGGQGSGNRNPSARGERSERGLRARFAGATPRQAAVARSGERPRAGRRSGASCELRSSAARVASARRRRTSREPSRVDAAREDNGRCRLARRAAAPGSADPDERSGGARATEFRPERLARNPREEDSRRAVYRSPRTSRQRANVPRGVCAGHRARNRPTSPSSGGEGEAPHVQLHLFHWAFWPLCTGSPGTPK